MQKRLAMLATCLLLGMAGTVRADALVTLQTRPGVHQAYWLLAGAQPRIVAVLFPGGAGLLQLSEVKNQVQAGRSKRNFLVRARELLRDETVAVALMDAPSDAPIGMDDLFRMGSAHRQDVAAVVQDLRQRYPGVHVYLVGTSRGAVSAAYVGRALGGRIDGVVLTSAVYTPGGRQPGLSGFDFDRLPGRVLLVHHAEDGCAFSPYSDAQRLARRFPLVTVHGGLPARSAACNALTPHGYYGREAETMAAIRAWLEGLPYPASIGAAG